MGWMLFTILYSTDKIQLFLFIISLGVSEFRAIIKPYLQRFIMLDTSCRLFTLNMNIQF